MNRRRITWSRRAIIAALLGAIFMVLPLSTVSAQDFSDYGNYNVSHIVLPEVMGGWFDAADFFPGEDGSGSPVSATIGSYEVAGRLVVANYQTIYLQKNYGAGCQVGGWTVGQDDLIGTNPDQHILPGGNDNFIPVATVMPVNGYPVGSGSMDPSFIKISPDGDRIALGMGWGQPLLVIDVSVLDPSSPPLLNGGDGYTPIAGVKIWSSPSVQYYDAEWVDNNRLAMNADYGWDPGSQTGSGSQVDILDVTNEANTRVTIVSNIGVGSTGGASADVTIDQDGHIITGNGYDYGDNSHTGELMMFDSGDWESAYNNGTPLDYQSQGFLLAHNVLSAAQLGVDKDNNLHVGGGSWLGAMGAELGYAAIIHAAVLANVIGGGSPVNESASGEYRELAPDPNADDSATMVLYNPWAEGLAVVWNPNGGYGMPGSDLWGIGVRPIMMTYYGATPPDADADGIPDGSDNAYLTPNPGQEDSDGDGWANAADADFDNNNIVNVNDFNQLRGNWLNNDPTGVTDMNSDGIVNVNDFNAFRSRWLQPAPYY
ncbi:MAG: hypothetical protein JJV98_11750 [Desulfosarcina sp.]|nr:hypothetical protein [Desulfobacterales bacterium]